MVNEQIFLAYSRDQNDDRVFEINQKLLSEGYNTWLDVVNGFAGFEFEDLIPKQIAESHLYLIFFSRFRKDKGFFNLELEEIRKYHKRIQQSDNKPRIVVVLLDPVEDEIDYWLNGFDRISYYQDEERGYNSLSSALHKWALNFKVKPPYISTLAKDKHKQEPESKKLLADWVYKNIMPILSIEANSILLGCGSTIYDMWFYRIKDYLFKTNNSKKINILTINDFILFHERELQDSGNNYYVEVGQIGNIHEEFYAAFKYANPEEELPCFDAAIISVAGLTVNSNMIGLNVCWESLVPMLRDIFNKTQKELIIIAAGRKIIEPEGSCFINLLDIKDKDNKFPYKIKFIIDDKIDFYKKNLFDEKIRQIDSHLGHHVSNPNIIEWSTT